MLKCNKNITLSMAILTGILFILGCAKKINQETGFLEGKISIGPICPVETIPPDPACLPTAETYKAYPVSIWTSDNSKRIAQINPVLDGSYKTELNPGKYLVILENAKNGIGRSNLPVKVSIYPQDKTILNINIDTGIR